MLVVMEQGATEKQIEAVIARLVELDFNVHRSTGVVHTLLGGVGGVEQFDLAPFEVMEGVKEAHRIVSPYKLASRSFNPGGTIIKIGDVEIGGSKVISMAGPCSIEGEEQIEACAALIAASSVQAATAAGQHHTRKSSRSPVMVNDQHRNSSNERPRDSNADGMCGLFPGPCQQ